MSNCILCKKKINPLMKDMYICRCTGVYCRIHLQNHNCSFDYNEHFRKHMGKSLVKVVSPKVAPIF